MGEFNPLQCCETIAAPKVDMLQQTWLDAYHRREYVVLPGDSLKCQHEERITYDALGNELELSTVEVLAVISPPVQQPLV